MRIHIFILTDPLTAKPIMSSSDLTASIDFAEKTFKDKFNVKLHKYSKDWVEIFNRHPPNDALEPGCGGTLYGRNLGKRAIILPNTLPDGTLSQLHLLIPLLFLWRETFKVKKDAHLTNDDWIVIDPDGVNA